MKGNGKPEVGRERKTVEDRENYNFKTVTSLKSASRRKKLKSGIPTSAAASTGRIAELDQTNYSSRNSAECRSRNRKSEICSLKLEISLLDSLIPDSISVGNEGNWEI